MGVRRGGEIDKQNVIMHKAYLDEILWDMRSKILNEMRVRMRSPKWDVHTQSEWDAHAQLEMRCACAPEIRCACADQSYICAHAILNKLHKRTPKWYMRAHLVLVCAGAYHLGLRTRISFLHLVPKAHQLPPSPAPFRICATGLFRKEHPILALQPVLTYLGHI